MLPVIAIVLVVLWGIGLLASFTLGGYIHMLVLLAVVLLLVRIIREPGARRPLIPVRRGRGS
jgi:hypothetical protein